MNDSKANKAAAEPPLDAIVRKRRNKMKWKCKDGRVLEVSEMGTDHLKNTIAMLRRNGVVTPDEFLSCLAYACSGDTPDGAAMAAEAEVDGMKQWNGLEVLEDELARRLTLEVRQDRRKEWQT